MDLLRFAAPWNAGIAVLVEDGEEPAPLEGARVLGIPRSQAADGGALVERLRDMRGEGGFELFLVPPAARRWAESDGIAVTLAEAFDVVADHAGSGLLYSLHDRRPADGLAPDGLPLAPAHLIRITSGCARQAHNNPPRMYRSYFDTGLRAAEWIPAMVARAGDEMAAMDAILDFGCGCGRVMRHWRQLERPRLHGCDYNPLLVEWCAANLPFAEFRRNRLEPPLPYADDAFDLLYTISIFTHLDEPLQRMWADELRRVVRPGGLVILTVSGPERLGHLPPEVRGRFDRGELVVWRSELAGMNACTVYHPERYVREELARGFELIEHARLGAPDVRQDAVLLRVPGQGAATRSGSPRAGG